MYLNPKSTERLFIRKLEISDVEEWKEYFINNPSLGLLGLDTDEDIQVKSEKFIKRQLERYEKGTYGLHALIEEKSKNLLGQCGLLLQEVDGKAELEIGYHLIPKYWGKGYAIEAARLFRDYGFENSLSESLISIINVKNFLSKKVAIKNGMHAIRKTTFHNFDVDIFKIEKKDWMR